MIKGFEDYTHDLTEEELEIARNVWTILQASRPEPITNAKICKKLSQRGMETTSPRVRKMINWMHIKGHLPNLIATSKGYHFAQSRKELSNYVESLQGRIMAIQGRWKRSLEDLKQWNDVEKT